MLKTGFLFSASEFSNHIIYEIQSIGDDEAKPIITYSTDNRNKLVTFNPREAKNLVVSDEL